ncbi:MAG: hypothetical protein KDC56_11740 [Flavobacteriaceae bacterium]|nr:hypothetical protein [Flavobacteriaceae bacterium]
MRIIIDHETAFLGLQISEREQWRNYFIGIDSDKKKLLYIKTYPSNYVKAIINLEDIIECRAIVEKKKSKEGNQYFENLRHTSLELTLLDSNEHIKYLEFYSADESPIENLEIPRIDKWNEAINKYVTKRKPLKKAS